MKKYFLAACVAVLSMAQSPAAWAQDAGFIENQQCFACHKNQKMDFQNSAHGRAFAADTASGCQTCHGGGAAHKEVAGQENYKGPQKIEAFKKAGSAADDQNSVCLTCHQKDANRMRWMGSAHQGGDAGCTSCHQIHTVKDRVLVKRTEPEVCYSCHKEQRAQSNRASHHPINEGKVVCSNCHNAHGSSGPKLLLQNTVNETCYTCHAEKRGPFLWEHAPVSDNCTNCHTSHGSNNAALLKNRQPYLCASCHIAGGHSTTGIRSGYDLGNDVVPGGAKAGTPSTTGAAAGSTAAAAQMVGKACLNCHSRIHGSNHPSGARFVR